MTRDRNGERSRCSELPASERGNSIGAVLTLACVDCLSTELRRDWIKWRQQCHRRYTWMRPSSAAARGKQNENLTVNYGLRCMVCRLVLDVIIELVENCERNVAGDQGVTKQQVPVSCFVASYTIIITRSWVSYSWDSLPSYSWDHCGILTNSPSLLSSLCCLSNIFLSCRVLMLRTNR